MFTWLFRKKQPEPPQKPTHDLFCECRKCIPAHGNFVKMIKEK